MTVHEAAGFEEFVAARWASMVRATVLLGMRPADAEDAVQEALARCWAAWPRVRSADDPDAYAYRVLVNVVRRAARRRWTGEVPQAEPPLPAGPPDGGGDPAYRDPALTVPAARSVRAALGRLSRAHRQVLVLRYFADLSEQQTARALGVAPGTVKSRASRAMALLALDPDLADATRATVIGATVTRATVTGATVTGATVTGGLSADTAHGTEEKT